MERQAAIVIAAAARLQARVAGMQAENMQRAALGCSMAYTEADFIAVIDDEKCGYNAVIATLESSR